MAASLAILLMLVFWLSVVRLHYSHKMAKIRGTASEFIIAFLESSWNFHLHNFVPNNTIKLILYVLYSPNG